MVEVTSPSAQSSLGMSTSYPHDLARTLRKGRPPLATIATSLAEIHHEYLLVEEAVCLLSSDTKGPANEFDHEPKLSFPPMYGLNSGPWDTATIPQTDDDEWLFLPPTVWNAEHVLQSEQVIKMLLQIKTWSLQEEIQTWAPSLAKLARVVVDDRNLDCDEDREAALHAVYAEIQGTVAIVRVRSIMDPTGKSSYNVRIKDGRFPVLDLLRRKEEDLLRRGGKPLDKSVIEIQNEIEATTEAILSGLAQKILSVAVEIDQGLNVVARLDLVMAKAAYGAALHAVIPVVQTEGEIVVEGFVHPVLARTIGMDRVVPVDLRLSSERGQSALVISGSNGGGKTLSMKSFGLASVLTKLGIPIPVKDTAKRPRVDFFDEILVNVGDRQSVLEGESTWTSILNSCASIIDAIDTRRTEQQNRSFLVLLDELGSGTDPEAGGAVAQAILEELLTKPCKMVVTTHSPRLKALSYSNPDFSCATVLLENDSPSEFKSPSFVLEYGIIGESHALGAASRSSPSLPQSVMSRASQLMIEAVASDGQGIGKDYILALTSSMEEQLKRRKEASEKAQAHIDDLEKCRRAMISLADSYDNHLERQCERLEDCFRRLKADGSSDLELVGEALSELRVVKKKIVSQKTLLAERGLKAIPTSYVLVPGESVVIISPGELEGMSAKFVKDSSTDRMLGQNEVLVQPSFSLHAWDDLVPSSPSMMNGSPLILQRHEIAIWDYGGVYDDRSSTLEPATSIPSSRKKIQSLLSTLNSISTDDKMEFSKGSGSKSLGKNSFKSSRQRKAVKKKQK